MNFRFFKRQSTLAVESALAALALGYVLVVAGLVWPVFSFVGVGVMLAGVGVVFNMGSGRAESLPHAWPAR